MSWRGHELISLLEKAREVTNLKARMKYHGATSFHAGVFVCVQGTDGWNFHSGVKSLKHREVISLIFSSVPLRPRILMSLFTSSLVIISVRLFNVKRLFTLMPCQLSSFQLGTHERPWVHFVGGNWERLSWGDSWVKFQFWDARCSALYLWRHRGRGQAGQENG